MRRHVFVLMFVSGLGGPVSAFPIQPQLAHVGLIEEAKGRVIVRPTKPGVVRKSSSPSFSLTIIRKEQRRPRKKTFVIPDIPSPK
jgi:hypothetical protein